MMNEKNRRDISERLRALISGQHDDLAACARLLGVDELSLRLSIDQDSPYPTVDVLIAVVARYGVARRICSREGTIRARTGWPTRGIR